MPRFIASATASGTAGLAIIYQATNENQLVYITSMTLAMTGNAMANSGQYGQISLSTTASLGFLIMQAYLSTQSYVSNITLVPPLVVPYGYYLVVTCDTPTGYNVDALVTGYTI